MRRWTGSLSLEGVCPLRLARHAARVSPARHVARRLGNGGGPLRGSKDRPPGALEESGRGSRADSENQLPWNPARPVIVSRGRKNRGSNHRPNPACDTRCESRKPGVRFRAKTTSQRVPRMPRFCQSRILMLHQYPIRRPAAIAVSQQTREMPPNTAKVACSRGESSRLVCCFQAETRLRAMTLMSPTLIAGNLM